MTINKTTENSTPIIALEDRPYAATALRSAADNTKLIADFAKPEYLSSAGLRVLHAARNVMSRQGEMIIRSVNKVIAEVFGVMGFSDIIIIG